MLEKVISDLEARELLQQVGERLELRDEVKAAIKHLSCTQCTVRMQVLLVVRQGRPGGIK